MGRFLEPLENDDVLVYFNVRTGHKHGTKMRSQDHVNPSLYPVITRN